MKAEVSGTPACAATVVKGSHAMLRETFEDQLRQLQDDLLAMGALVDRAIERSVQALADHDVELAQEIIDDDVLINQAQREIEDKCLVLIATQQPMASDLRVIASVSTIANELERMGDHAEGIGKITLMLGHQPLLKPLIDIPRMAEKGRSMLRQQLEAFVRRDVEMARNLATGDEEVDALYDQIYRELLIFMMDDPRTITRATHLLWVAHNLERIADRTTNIGERVIYLVTGEVEELNP
jgi:phosphate transport system protein